MPALSLCNDSLDSREDRDLSYPIMSLLFRALTCLLILSAALIASADSPEWQVSLAAADITPPKPIQMAGYGGRLKPFDRVEQNIFAKAMCFKDAQGHRALLITTDVVGIESNLIEPVCQRIVDQTGLKRDDILVNYSHSHSGPLLSLTVKPSVGVTSQNVADIVENTKRTQDLVTDLGVRAAGPSATFKPAKLSWGWGYVNFVMNRREFTPNGVTLGVNPRGPVDRMVPVLRIDPADGDPSANPLAVLFACACHNTTLTDRNYLICGDYAGFAQHLIQEKLPDTQAMFMIGCGADANPYPRNTLALAKEHGNELATEVLRVLTGQPRKLKPIRGPITVAFDHVDLPLRSVTRADLQRIVDTKKPSWLLTSAPTMLAMLDRGETLPTVHNSPVSVWQFGQDLTLVGMPGETVGDYAHLVEQAIGPTNLWPAGYCTDQFGYLPSKRVLAEGGYECRGLKSFTGSFAPEAQDALVNKVKELAKKAGRKMPPTDR